MCRYTCLLCSKRSLSLWHAHLASVLWGCCRFSPVFLCWPQTFYWSPLGKPHPNRRQRKLSCSPNNWSVLFCYGEGIFGFVLFLPCTSYLPLTQEVPSLTWEDSQLPSRRWKLEKVAYLSSLSLLHLTQLSCPAAAASRSSSRITSRWEQNASSPTHFLL